MKNVVILLACVVSFNAIGQIDKQKMQTLNKIQKYRKMRSIGLVMVVAGATMGIVGISRLVNTSQTSNNASTQDVALWVAGGPIFSAGIPVSIIGHANMKKYEKKLRTNSGVTLNLNLSPRRQGLTLTYRF